MHLLSFSGGVSVDERWVCVCFRIHTQRVNPAIAFSKTKTKTYEERTEGTNFLRWTCWIVHSSTKNGWKRRLVRMLLKIKKNNVRKKVNWQRWCPRVIGGRVEMLSWVETRVNSRGSGRQTTWRLLYRALNKRNTIASEWIRSRRNAENCHVCV